MAGAHERETGRRIFRLLVLYRWVSLAPPLLYLLSGGGRWAGLALLLAGLPTLLITLLFPRLNRALRAMPWLLLADLLLVSLPVALTGGWQSPYYLYALTPLLAAAFFFELRGALLATALLTPFYLAAVLAAWGRQGPAPEWPAVFSDLIGFYLLAGAFGYAARLLAQLRQTGRSLGATHRDLEVLHRLAAGLHNAPDVAAVQQQLLEAVAGDLGFRKVVLGLVAEQEPVLTGWVGQWRQGAAEEVKTLSHAARLPLGPEGGVAARALLEGRICRATEEPCTPDGWLNSYFAMENCLIIPLLWGRQPVGILLVDTTGQEADETRLHSLEAITGQTAVAIGMMRTRSRRARESAVQAERGRIALEMHDAVSQSLFGLVFTLDGSLKLLDSDPQALRPELEWALHTAEKTHQQIRHTIHELWTEEITAGSFTADLQQYVADVLQAPTLQVQFDIRGDFDALSPRARRSLYRMAQESLNNVVQHAAASEARVCLDVAGGRARLAVRDDGRGFEPEEGLAREPEQEPFGLRGMQERARSLGGTCDIFSQPGAGTSVIIDIPAARPANGDALPGPSE